MVFDLLAFCMRRLFIFTSTKLFMISRSSMQKKE